MTRAITFPRQANGDYVNRETGVMFQRYQSGWRAFRPAMTSTGYIGLCTVVRNMAVARDVARRYAEREARPAIAQAYDEAMAEDIARAATEDALCPHGRLKVRRDDGTHGCRPDCPLDASSELARSIVEAAHAEALAEDAQRTQARGEQNHRSGWIRRASEINRATGCGFLAARQTVMDELHAEALTEDEQRGTSRRLDIEMCHGLALREEARRFMAGGPGCSSVCTAMSPAESEARNGGHHTDCDRYVYSVAGPAGRFQIDGRGGARWPEDRGREPWVSRAWDMARAEQARREAAGIIAGARTENSSTLGLPPVPDDVDDDAAWAAYCELLPEPTEAERLATARDHGPYARERAEAVDTFISAVRAYRRQRTAPLDELGGKVLVSLRKSMATAARAVRLYDLLTAAWLAGEKSDAARDAFRHTF